jgi:hypothetical protein
MSAIRKLINKMEERRLAALYGKPRDEAETKRTYIGSLTPEQYQARANDGRSYQTAGEKDDTGQLVRWCFADEDPDKLGVYGPWLRRLLNRKAA